MSKNWETVFTNATKETRTKAEQVRQAQTAEKMLRSLSSRKEVNLKKEGDDAFAVQAAREDSLIAAFGEKKLKSKALIKEAKSLIAKREKIAKTKEKKARKETADVK